MAAPSRREYLERLISGLEQSIENLQWEVKYYKPGDIQGKYAQKFLESCQQNLAEADAELNELLKAEGQAPKEKKPKPGSPQNPA